MSQSLCTNSGRCAEFCSCVQTVLTIAIFNCKKVCFYDCYYKKVQKGVLLRLLLQKGAKRCAFTIAITKRCKKVCFCDCYYTFLQLKMANRQNCLNAGAKLGKPPTVGAERLADVRNLSPKLGFSSSLSISSTLCVKNGISSKQFLIHSKRFVKVQGLL